MPVGLAEWGYDETGNFISKLNEIKFFKKADKLCFLKHGYKILR